jgi:UDP-hydrolysing UDP-N-acetyl-D-glucosamine 2-epimerase
MTTRRRVCVVIGSRANYASIRSALVAIDRHEQLDLLVVVAASAVLDRYGSVEDIIVRDGFEPVARVHMVVEGETPLTMAKSAGLGLLELPTVFDVLQPHVVITIGDRFETMATTLAAAYMNIPLAHTMGGEVSGSIDESIRHATTKFAHVHFPASAEAQQRIVRLGESPERVHLVGCPRIDMTAEVLARNHPSSVAELISSLTAGDGVGARLKGEEPFLLVSQHPVTTEYGSGERQVLETLAALEELSMPTLMLWPNADAGADDVSRGIRKFRERGAGFPLHVFKNLPPETYIRLMAASACVIGNSSSAIREGAFIGSPAVNIGSRQQGRERSANVIDVGHDKAEIVAAVRSQIEHGPYPPSSLYGDGTAGDQIASVLAQCALDTDKRLTY